MFGRCASNAGLLFFCAFALCGVASAQDPPPASEIPIERCDVLPVVKVRIDGAEMRFLLDTAATTVLNIKSFSSGRSKEIHISSWAGTVPTSAREVSLPELVFGEHHLRDLSLPAIDLSPIGTACGGKIDGILGVDLLDKIGVTIDLKRRVAFFAPVPQDARAVYHQMLQRRQRRGPRRLLRSGNCSVHAAGRISWPCTGHELPAERLSAIRAKTFLQDGTSRSKTVWRRALVFLRLHDRFAERTHGWPRHVHVPQRRRPLAHSESAQFASRPFLRCHQRRVAIYQQTAIKKGAIARALHQFFSVCSSYFFADAGFTNISSSIARLFFTCVSRILITAPFSVLFIRNGTIIPSTSR